jgi:hypothetical protein
MTPEQIKTATDADLTQWLKNALATSCCAGHTKGHMNEVFAKQYRQELIERGNSIPSIDFWECFRADDHSYRQELIEGGTYNGPGSF